MIHSGADSTEHAAGGARRAMRAESAMKPPVPAAETPREAVGADCTANFAAEIFDRLFDLLKRQLRALTLEWRGGYGQPSEHSDLRALNARILECAAALDHMHAALGPDIARMRQTERELHRTRNAFLRAQAELDETRNANGRGIGLGNPGP